MKVLKLDEYRAMSWVLFYDGDCAFCSASVRRVVRLDHQQKISFAPLQGDLASELGLAHHASKIDGTMVLLRESDGEVFLKSDALIELARALGGLWRLTSLARFVPKPLRDKAYGWIANHRSRFLKNSESCFMPDSTLEKRLRK